jgi:hypothetical protein
MPLLKATVINAAEGILDPLWDPKISGLKHWQVEPGKAHGLRVWQNWCWSEFEWARRPASGPALRMTRQFEADCTGYDRVVVSLMAPLHSVCKITAVTDAGVRTFVSPPAPELKKEHVLELGGAKMLHSLTLEIESDAEGVSSGWINWVGLQHSQLLERVKWMWNQFDAAWTGYLQPESYEPKFEPTHGLLVNGRARGTAHQARRLPRGARESAFTKAADAARKLEPERMVREFVNFWNDTRYNRERDHDNSLLATMPVGHAVNAVVAGLLLKDKALLRLGARFAMALGMSGRWDDGVICYLPGGVFEHRCFVQSLCVHEIALVLDLAGEMFTEVAREYLKRRIAEEGLGSINFNTWKHDYIFHCNQLAWFTPGRMAGYTLLEKTWPRAKTYTEIAYAELNESLGYAILPDGGYVEGPTYFRCVARDGGLALYYYARARGKELRDIIPGLGPPHRRLRRGRAFDRRVRTSSPSVMPGVRSSRRPWRSWRWRCRKRLGHAVPQVPRPHPRHGRYPARLQTRGRSPRNRTRAPAFRVPARHGAHGVHPPARRRVDEDSHQRQQGRAGHAHEDKGGFVLEYRGETYAMDPGTCDYSSPLAGILKELRAPQHAHPDRPDGASLAAVAAELRCASDRLRVMRCALPPASTPRPAGATTAGGSAPGIRRRRTSSPSPTTTNSRPDGGTGVEFYWQTALAVTVSGQTITLTGQHGRAVIEAPAGTTIRVDDLPMPPGRVQRRIAIIRPATQGSLTVAVRLS